MGNVLQIATCMPHVFVKASLIILQAHNYPQTHTHSCMQIHISKRVCNQVAAVTETNAAATVAMTAGAAIGHTMYEHL